VTKGPRIAAADQNEALIAAGQRLRKMREQREMSQEKLSIAADVDQSKLSKAERLGPQYVSVAKLASIAEVLDCILEIDFRPKIS
jgi:transcriptional regulator with XRE-family HTH domain